MIRGGPEHIDSSCSPVERLSRGQKDILRLTAQGLTNYQIANEMGLAKQTIKNKINGVLSALGDQSSFKAVLHCIEEGAFSLEEVTSHYPLETIQKVNSLRENCIDILDLLSFYGYQGDAAKALGLKKQTVKNYLNEVHSTLEVPTTIQSILIYKRALELGVISKKVEKDKESLSVNDIISLTTGTINESVDKLRSNIGLYARQNQDRLPPSFKIGRIGSHNLVYYPGENKLVRVFSISNGNKEVLEELEDSPHRFDWINFSHLLIMRMSEEMRKSRT